MTREEFQKKYGIIGKSQEIKDLVDIVMQVAKSDISVLLYGESGVGKEVFARAIHNYSSRADKQLVSVNCGAIPEGILESELFGHKKGSFTGASESRKGYFEIADDGTLFLDEIAEMPLTTQVKLLRVLESKEFMKIGAETVTKVDVRIIAATNKDLEHEVSAKRFRKDLYFRLKAVTLNIPPLRNRQQDIRELAEYFIDSYAEAHNRKPPVLTTSAIEFLKEYNWPGNVRELKNTLESVIALNRSNTIDVDSFRPFFQADKEEIPRNLPVSLKKSAEDLDRELLYRALFEIKKDLVELKDLILDKSNEINLNKFNEEERDVLPLDEVEREAIKNALIKTNGNKRNAAKLLNISERTLYRKIKEYDI